VAECIGVARFAAIRVKDVGGGAGIQRTIRPSDRDQVTGQSVFVANSDLIGIGSPTDDQR
jgi:hypothetical protein